MGMLRVTFAGYGVLHLVAHLKDACLLFVVRFDLYVTGERIEELIHSPPVLPVLPGTAFLDG